MERGWLGMVGAGGGWLVVLLEESGLGGRLGELRTKDEKREKNIRKVRG